MRLRVDLSVVLEVNEEILEENGESMSDGALANLLAAEVERGSFLSCVDEAVEATEHRVATFFRLTG